MSRRLNTYKHHLRFLASCDKKQCTHLLKSADTELIKCICECALNILKGNIPLQSDQRKRLQKHKHKLRQLTGAASITEKKKIIQKGAGFLPFLLAPIISALGSILLK